MMENMLYSKVALVRAAVSGGQWLEVMHPAELKAKATFLLG